MRFILGVLAAALCLTGTAEGAVVAGGIQQVPGEGGCITEFAGTGCGDGRGLQNAYGLGISPDGKFAYIANNQFGNRALTTYSIDAATGALTEVAAGCLSGSAIAGCAAFPDISHEQIVISPDGRNAYVGASRQVRVLTRDTATGVLSPMAGTTGCVTFNGDGGTCGEQAMLDDITDLQVAPDGRHVYALVDNSVGGIVVLARDEGSGGLTPIAAPAGCVSLDSLGGCNTGRGLVRPQRISLSPDGRSAYVGSFGDGGFTNAAVSVFARDPGTGALVQPGGPAGCVGGTSNTEGCATGTAIVRMTGLDVSPDGKNLYAAALNGSAIAVFSRDAATSEITKLPGAAGCVSQSGTGGACTAGRGLTAMEDVVVSGDGQTVVGAGADSDGAVTAFARHPQTGALTQAAGALGCLVDDSGEPACGDGLRTAQLWRVETTPNGRFAIAASYGESAILSFAVGMAPVCADASASVVTGGTVSIPLVCRDGNDESVTRAIASGPDAGTVSVAGDTASYTAAGPGVASFTFTGSDGTNTSVPATVTVTATDAVPAPPAEPAAAAPPGPGPAVAATPKKVALSSILTLPSGRTCASRRRFRIRLRKVPGTRIVLATVLVNGKRVRVVKGKRLTAPVDLRGLPRGRFTVKISVKLADGRTVSGTRKYKTCAKKERRRKKG